MLKIISKLWSSICDLLFLIQGRPVKSLDEIQKDLDVIEMMCRPYADTDSEYADPDFLKEGDEK